MMKVSSSSYGHSQAGGADALAVSNARKDLPDRLRQKVLNLPPEERDEKRSAGEIAVNIADQISNSLMNATSDDSSAPPLTNLYKMYTVAGPHVNVQSRFLSHDTANKLVNYPSRG